MFQTTPFSHHPIEPCRLDGKPSKVESFYPPLECNSLSIVADIPMHSDPADTVEYLLQAISLEENAQPPSNREVRWRTDQEVVAPVHFRRAKSEEPMKRAKAKTDDLKSPSLSMPRRYRSFKFNPNYDSLRKYARGISKQQTLTNQNKVVKESLKFMDVNC